MQITRITKYPDIILIKLSFGELLTERVDEEDEEEEAANEEEAGEDEEAEDEEEEEAEPEAEDGRRERGVSYAADRDGR